MDKVKLEPIAYWTHGFIGLLGALLFIPFVGVYWFAGLFHWWPVLLVIAIVATISGFFFRPTAILSLLLLLMVPGMVSGAIPDFAIAGYTLAAIAILVYWRFKKRNPDRHRTQ